MTATEAARALRISRTSLQRLYIDTGKLIPCNPPLGAGLSRHRRLWFRADDVRAIADQFNSPDAAPRLVTEPPGDYDPRG